jgi:hypothetical protein
LPGKGAAALQSVVTTTKPVSIGWRAEQASTGAEEDEGLLLQAGWQIAEQVAISVLLTQGWELHISKGF